LLLADIAAALEEEDRKWATQTRLIHPFIAYEDLATGDGDIQFPCEPQLWKASSLPSSFTEFEMELRRLRLSAIYTSGENW